MPRNQGSNLGHGFSVVGRFRGSQWATKKLASGSRCFDFMAREKQQACPVPAARFPQAGTAAVPSARVYRALRSHGTNYWPTERFVNILKYGQAAGEGGVHPDPIPFAWQWPAASLRPPVGRSLRQAARSRKVNLGSGVDQLQVDGDRGPDRLAETAWSF